MKLNKKLAYGMYQGNKTMRGMLQELDSKEWKMLYKIFEDYRSDRSAFYSDSPGLMLTPVTFYDWLKSDATMEQIEMAKYND